MSHFHDITLPDFTLAPASAGAGKTTALTRRFLQLILTVGLPHNDLRNILAVTFTKNAAGEMKERILETLKRAALGDNSTIRELQEVMDVDAEEVRSVAGMYVEKILDEYSDFQVQTIDSFITRVLRASAMDLGLPPEFEVDFNPDAVLNEALDLFAREIASDPAKQELLANLIDLISENRTAESRYLWNPLDTLAKEIHVLYRQLSSQTGEPKFEDSGTRLQELRQEILSRLQTIGKLSKRPGLVVSKHYAEIIERAHAGDIDAVTARTLSQKILNKPKGDYDTQAAAQVGALQEEIVTLTSEYVFLKSRARYAPYIQAYRMIQHHIEHVKRRREAVFLGEANRSLAHMLNAEIVPEIYFSLGEQIHHFLVDEFQDTSPIQWAVLRPLVEHSLGGRGSLFVVGDTKQSIYTFRGADWRIMGKMMERDEFPSVKTRLLPLTTNYRSAEALVEFTKEVFHARVPTVIAPDVSDLSGLASYTQNVRLELKGKGYVEVRVVEPPASDEEKEHRAENPPEREHLLHVVRDCRARGYG
ncbi:MAG TPA: UvrD-helicase domain-containing protein, partial [Bacteroidota bacterium]